MIFRGELLERARQATVTPERFVLNDAAVARFSSMAERARGLGRGPAFRPSYSVKTNPGGTFLELARSHGFLAEVISNEEAFAAREASFGDDSIVHNGPRTYRRNGAFGPFFAAFADSPEMLETYVREEAALTLGVRIRPRGIGSRFGVEAGEFDAVAATLKRAPADARVGTSMHVRAEDYAPRSWLELLEEFVALSERLQSASGRALHVLDIGGGWTPRALERAFEHDFPACRAMVRDTLREVDTILFEPGQSLLTELEAIVCSVIEVRHLRGEIVVDAGFSEVPHIRSYAHRLYWLDGDALVPVERGSDRILGPLCLEYDVVASDVRLRDGIAAGDRLVIADCGSYDSSMSFSFGRGRERGRN